MRPHLIYLGVLSVKNKTHHHFQPLWLAWLDRVGFVYGISQYEFLKARPVHPSHRLMIITLLARSISYIGLHSDGGLDSCSAAGISSLHTIVQPSSLGKVWRSAWLFSVSQVARPARLKKSGKIDSSISCGTIQIANDQVTWATRIRGPIYVWGGAGA